jgi:hypothetical protein
VRSLESSEIWEERRRADSAESSRIETPLPFMGNLYQKNILEEELFQNKYFYGTLYQNKYIYGTFVPEGHSARRIVPE